MLRLASAVVRRQAPVGVIATVRAMSTLTDIDVRTNHQLLLHTTYYIRPTASCHSWPFTMLFM
jgi:hypothetical protein